MLALGLLCALTSCVVPEVGSGTEPTDGADVFIMTPVVALTRSLYKDGRFIGEDNFDFGKDLNGRWIVRAGFFYIRPFKVTGDEVYFWDFKYPEYFSGMEKVSERISGNRVNIRTGKYTRLEGMREASGEIRLEREYPGLDQLDFTPKNMKPRRVVYSLIRDANDPPKHGSPPIREWQDLPSQTHSNWQ